MPSATVVSRPNRWSGRSAALALVALISSLGAHAQLQPSRLYYGVNRPVPMTASAPAGTSGAMEITLHKATGEEIAKAGVPAAGNVDLASLFPDLWTTKEPAVAYAQLSVGGKKIGPGVVLQPLVSPDSAWVADRNARDMQWVKSQKVHSGLRAYVNKDVLFKTTAGDIRFALRPDQAPNTAWNFRHLAEGGFYTDIPFHRIIGPNSGNRGFVIQGGDPTGQGNGGPGYMIDLEPSRLSHDFGVLSMARSSDPNSNGSQVFICLSREATAGLDNLYTSFGYAISGADVIVKLGATPVKDPRSGSPVEAPKIVSAELVDAAPMGEGAGRVTDPTPVAVPVPNPVPSTPAPAPAAPPVQPK